MNLVETVGEAAAAHPERPAIVYEDRELSYEAFWTRAGQFAQALVDRGLGAGTRVAVYLPNLPQFATAFHGTLRMGGVIVPMNPQYKRRELEHLLGDSGAEVVVTLPDLVQHVEPVRDDTNVEHVVSIGDDAGDVSFEGFLADDTHPVVDRDDDDVACQPYTSGTTGTPKGVLLTHENLHWDADAALDPVPGGVQPEDRHLGVLPLFHIYGMTVTMNATLFAGAAYYPVPEWNAKEVMELIEDEELTLIHAVPAMYNDMVNEPGDYDFSSVRFANSGGSALPMEVLRAFEDRFDVDLHEGYGLTETSPVTHANRVGERRAGSIGRALDGLQARVVTDDFEDVPPVEEGPVDESEVDLSEITGELVVAGPNVMKGYFERPQANEEAFTVEDGTRWFHTGDMAYHDEDGFYYLVDRKKHMIVTGGYNVYPREVEELLFEHPDVKDAAVVGIPDDRRGETVKAFVVPAPDATASPEDIKQYCLERLAAYKHPREVEFVDELPRTTTGKVQKFELND
ncbi:long-chain-fatty-acid--CoA ligase [Halocalculus aciditolerans]|uniref:Long-chain-fatty-acid--CoA ligase n=1 Tax=Halocalculus aciditolerans TaxID=1383812 RepID=A0A830FEX1_9EURY|nr:long-chain fatty acid--CoA ligase [Halocalculus aciditolerans]GGL48482.1 long-chain-fatty-acid--CoA ligase [Halocalculus aciditolerans]